MGWLDTRDERLDMILLVSVHESSGTGSDAPGSPQSKSANLLAWWARKGEVDRTDIEDALDIVRRLLADDRDTPAGHNLERGLVILTRALELLNRPPENGWE